MDTLKQQGSSLFANAMPGIRSTLNYYQTLLNGDRAARTAAVANEAEQVGQAYQGADQGVKQNLRGGERDQALAENSRQRAGQIAKLTTGVRPAAADALSEMGSNLVGQSGQFEGTAGNIGANLLGNSTNNRQFGYQAGERAGQSTAAQIGQLVSQLAGAFGGGGGSQGLIGRQTTPNWGTLPTGGGGISY